MVLIEYKNDVAENSNNNNGFVPSTADLSNSNELLNELNQRMSETLMDKSLRDDEKIMIHGNLMRRYLHVKEESKREKNADLNRILELLKTNAEPTAAATTTSAMTTARDQWNSIKDEFSTPKTSIKLSSSDKSKKIRRPAVDSPSSSLREANKKEKMSNRRSNSIKPKKVNFMQGSGITSWTSLPKHFY